VTNVVLPDSVPNAHPVVREKEKEKEGYHDDRPPTPPPKDDKPRPKSKSGKSAGIVPSIKYAARPPMIGNLSFESKSDGAERPGLESFVTAREGEELRGK
jgi:hypothetical protein